MSRDGDLGGLSPRIRETLNSSQRLFCPKEILHKAHYWRKHILSKGSLNRNTHKTWPRADRCGQCASRRRLKVRRAPDLEETGGRKASGPAARVQHWQPALEHTPDLRLKASVTVRQTGARSAKPHAREEGKPTSDMRQIQDRHPFLRGCPKD